jgi:hypothetical protein
VIIGENLALANVYARVTAVRDLIWNVEVKGRVNLRDTCPRLQDNSNIP